MLVRRPVSGSCRGLAFGLVLGPGGTVLIAGVSQCGTVDPPMSHTITLSSASGGYRIGYLAGYSKGAKSKRLASSIAGSVIGTAVIVAILLSSQSNGD